MLAHMLKNRTNHSFQSFAVSTTSLFDKRSFDFSRPSLPYACCTYLAPSICILLHANSRSFSVRNQADPGPIGIQTHEIKAKKHVREPSIMKRYCQLCREPFSWNTPYAGNGQYVASTLRHEFHIQIAPENAPAIAYCP
jgi:hypothetical protein